MYAFVAEYVTIQFDELKFDRMRKMIIDSFNIVDACIITFSHIIEKYVQDNYDLKQIGQSVAVTGHLPIYQFNHGEKKFTFLKTYTGTPACVATIEDTLSELKAI